MWVGVGVALLLPRRPENLPKKGRNKLLLSRSLATAITSRRVSRKEFPRLVALGMFDVPRFEGPTFRKGSALASKWTDPDTSDVAPLYARAWASNRMPPTHNYMNMR